MADYTKNYSLKKPLPDEFYDVEDQNGNMDILDTVLAEHQNNTAVHFPEGGILPVERGGTGGVTAADARTKLGAAGNPNLLDNWYFADPINQREWADGLTSWQYSLDRWLSNDVNVTVNDGYVTLAQAGTSNLFFIQRIENDFYKEIAGKKITISALLRNGILKTATVTAPDFREHRNENVDVDGLVMGVFSLYDSNSGAEEHGFTIFPEVGRSFDIVALKAEIGLQQTLARQENGVWVLNDPPPNKQQELAKCQRYFTRIKSIPPISSNIAYGQYFTQRACVNMATPVPMRDAVAISIHNCYIRYNATMIQIDESNTIDWIYNTVNGIQLAIKCSGPSSYAFVVLVLNDGGYIDVIADL